MVRPEHESLDQENSVNGDEQATDDDRASEASSSNAPQRAVRFAMVRWETIDPARWSRGFSALKELGFDGVDLPIVWSAHERDDRSRDFTSGRRAVDTVIRAATSEGLSVRVRVGPRCVEGEAAFGVPRRVLQEQSALARNARRGAVLEPIGLVPTPAPSFASKAFRDASTSWVRSVVEHLARQSLDAIDAVVIGPGTFAPLRADGIEADHHPEAGPVPTSQEERAVRAERSMAAYCAQLLDAALSSGAPREKLRASLIGARATAAGASTLAATHALDASTPFSASGTDSIWTEVRAAIASSPHGVHFDVGCGSSPFARPLRNRDAASAARVVVAAGARSFTVRYAWVGDGWVGSLLDPTGVTQRAAMRWRALFDECASVPAAASVGLDEVAGGDKSWIRPVYGAWLAQYDLLSKRSSKDLLAPVGLRSDQASSVFARREGDTLVLLSASERAVTVRDDARGWIADGSIELAPGAVVTCARTGVER